MLDLYLILIPAIFIVAFVGMWILKGIQGRARTFGRFVTAFTALAVGGIIALAFAGGVLGVISLALVAGYWLYNRKSK